MHLVYNRVAKAGSSFMIHALMLLSKSNRFRVLSAYRYDPSKAALAAQLAALPDDSVYVNHADFLNGTHLTWINVIRDPIARWASLHDYEVDVKLRGARATREIAARAQDARCGCAGLDFDGCVRVRFDRNCSLAVPSQMVQFCEPDARCDLATAMRAVASSYALVGMTEDLPRTLMLLERLVPRFFGGASRLRTNVVRPTTKNANHTVAAATQQLIRARAPNYDEEVEFYSYVRARFERAWAAGA